MIDPSGFRSGLSTVPGNAKVHYNYANFLKDSGRAREAVHHYRESLQLAPDHAVSHNNLGILLEGKEAEFHFREAVKHNPQHYKAFYNLARNLEYVHLHNRSRILFCGYGNVAACI